MALKLHVKDSESKANRKALANAIRRGRADHPEWAHQRGAMWIDRDGTSISALFPPDFSKVTAACAMGFAIAGGWPRDRLGPTIYMGQWGRVGVITMNDTLEMSLDDILTKLEA